MRKRRFELDTRIMMVFLLVAMPFVAVGAYFVVTMGRSAMRESVAQTLEQRAVETRFRVERYVGDHAALLRLIAAWPDVKASLHRTPGPMSPEEQQQLNEAWASGDAALIAGLLRTPVAERLRGVLEIRPGIKLLQVVDDDGRLLASSAHAGRVLNGDTEWFTAVAEQGLEPHTFVGDVERRRPDEAALYDVAWPIRNEEGFFVGAVRAACDAADLYTVLAPVRIGSTGRAVLMHAKDGRVLASDDDGEILRAQYPGFPQLQAAMLELRGSWQVPEIERRTPEGESLPVAPARLVGYSPVTQIPGIEWLVAVEQELAEASAPIDQIRFWLWLHFLAAFSLTILLGLYFMFQVETPVIEEALHLHEEHVPPSERRAAEGARAG